MLHWKSKPTCLTTVRIMEQSYQEGIMCHLGLPIQNKDGFRIDSHGKLRRAQSHEDGYTLQSTRWGHSIQDLELDIDTLIQTKRAYGLPFPDSIGHIPCLFLDRDGILIEDVGYPHQIKDLKFIPETLDLIKIAQQHQYKIIVVTNQAGLAKRVFNEQQYHRFTTAMKDQLRQLDIDLDHIYYCPYHKEGQVFKRDSLFRKPHPGMILQACLDHSIDLTKSLMVGDKDSDIIQLKGLQSVLIQGKYPLKHNPVHNIQNVQELITLV